MRFRPFPDKSEFRSQEFPGAPIDTSPEGYLVAIINGSARGSPGPAGYGVVLEDEVGRSVATLSEFVGTQISEYAEYGALLAALNYTLRHGFKAMKVTSDSELLVEQVCGESEVRDQTAKELFGRVMKMLDQFNYFEIKHNPAAGLREASRLAHAAIDRGIVKKAPVVEAPDVGGIASVMREVDGVIRNGVVQLIGHSLPEGMHVKVRPTGQVSKP